MNYPYVVVRNTVLVEALQWRRDSICLEQSRAVECGRQLGNDSVTRGVTTSSERPSAAGKDIRSGGRSESLGARMGADAGVGCHLEDEFLFHHGAGSGHA